MNKKIAIIGFGHMGKAFYEGLLFSGVKKENIFVSNSSEDNKKMVSDADWIILALKPKAVTEVLADSKDIIANKIVFSVACGVTFDMMQKVTGNKQQKLIRLMPNLPVAFGKGVIGIFKNTNVSDQEKKEVLGLLSLMGTIIDCKKEEELDALTILSGSGPAVVAYCLSLFEQTGEAFGFTNEDAKKISYQTFLGTLTLLKETNQTANALQEAVATKGGTTEQIIRTLQEEHVDTSFKRSFDKGYARIRKIGEVLGQNQD